MTVVGILLLPRCKPPKEGESPALIGRSKGGVSERAEHDEATELDPPEWTSEGI